MFKYEQNHEYMTNLGKYWLDRYYYCQPTKSESYFENTAI